MKFERMRKTRRARDIAQIDMQRVSPVCARWYYDEVSASIFEPNFNAEKWHNELRGGSERLHMLRPLLLAY